MILYTYIPTIVMHFSPKTFCPQGGWTALHVAAEDGRVDVVRLLIEAKAQVDIQSEV